MELDRLIEQICREYLEQLLAHRRPHGVAGPEADRAGLERFIREEEGRMLAGDRSLVEADAHKLLAEVGRQLGDRDFDRLCGALQRTFIRGCRLAHSD
jgi:hypothetical protein